MRLAVTLIPVRGNKSMLVLKTDWVQEETSWVMIFSETLLEKCDD